MFQSTLLFGALLAFLNAGIYLYVGRVLSGRKAASPDARLAWGLFVLWWYALAVTTFCGGLLSLLGAFGITLLPLFTTINIVNLLATCVALYGLMFYLLYLFTGRRLLWPLAGFYFAYFILLVYYVQARVPTGVLVERWRATLAYQNPPGTLFVFALLLLVFPQIIGSLAYFTLFYRVEAPTQKYRILLVSWSIIIWFLSAFLASISGLADQDWWQIASRLLGLGAALAILFSYLPPAWIRRRFGIASMTEETA
jgi:hypothetical protein